MHTPQMKRRRYFDGFIGFIRLFASSQRTVHKVVETSGIYWTSLVK